MTLVSKFKSLKQVEKDNADKKKKNNEERILHNAKVIVEYKIK